MILVYVSFPFVFNRLLQYTQTRTKLNKKKSEIKLKEKRDYQVVQGQKSNNSGNVWKRTRQTEEAI